MEFNWQHEFSPRLSYRNTDWRRRVLVTGGISTGDGPDNAVEKTAEIYDPHTGAWSLVDHMAQARWGHTATLLSDGTVLIAGGTGPAFDGMYTLRAEIYSPESDRWRNVDSMTTPRGFHVAALLSSGRVLVAGGLTLPHNERNVSAAAELFQPSTKRWTPTDSMAVARGAGPYAPPFCRMVGSLWPAEGP